MNVHEERWAAFEALQEERAVTTDPKRLAELDAREEALREQGIRDLLAEEMQEEQGWCWLSFVDTTTDTFLGVCLVPASGIMEATMIARAHGCNPGGEVQGSPILGVPPEHLQYRLLDKEEALAVQAEYDGDFR
jgi:hypothetical protein